MLFQIPTPLAKRFKASVPSGQRSKVVSDLLETAVSQKREADQKVCRRVNRIKKLNGESAAWEKFDDTDAA